MHALAYPLEYLHQDKPDDFYRCFAYRERMVVMFRVSPDPRLGETDDSFLVRDALTNEFLGAGDTKDEANRDAQYRLMDESRKQYTAQLAVA